MAFPYQLGAGDLSYWHYRDISSYSRMWTSGESFARAEKCNGMQSIMSARYTYKHLIKSSPSHASCDRWSGSRRSFLRQIPY